MSSNISNENALADLAHLKTLAEAGRSAPSQSGPFLVSWGVLLAGALAGHAYVMAPGSPTPPWAVWAVWGSFAVVAFAAQGLLGARLSQSAVASAVTSRVDGAIWSGASLIMAALSVGFILRMFVTQDFTAPNAIPGVAFAVYGGAMLASSVFSHDPTQRFFAVLSGAAGFGLTIFADAPWMYYAASAAALLVLALPGVLLMARRPASGAKP